MMKILVASITPLLFFYNPMTMITLLSVLTVSMTLLMKHEEMMMYPSSLFIWDSLAIMMILLTLWITMMMILTKFNNKMNNPPYFIITLLMLFLVLTFSVNKLLHFYVLFEMTLVPTFMLIMGWGHQPERIQASFYMLLYTVLFSLPLLLSSINYTNMLNSSMIMISTSMKMNFSVWSLMFMLAFLVKLPVYFMHLWLPKAHVEAPVEGSMVLAGVLLKLGGYGLMRITPIIKPMLKSTLWLFMSWVLVGGLYASMMCLNQMDIKLLIALSSVAHMSLVVGGIFSMNKWGMNGAIYMMIAHGVCSSGMFYMNNMMYERMNSRSLLMLKNFSSFLPLFMLSWFIILAANMAAPPSLNLVSEMMLISSLMSTSAVHMIPLSLMVFTSASYSLFLYSSTSHGKLSNLSISIPQSSLREGLICFLHTLPIFMLLFTLNQF